MSGSAAIDPSFDMIEIAPERRLHHLVEGPEGAPFVLFDAGAFGIYADGWWLKENLKRDFRVCLYDRAGMGASDPVPEGVTPGPEFHVEDMRRLRTALGEEGAFILIGHSMAGLRLAAYANMHPEELRGLVFIDALSPAQFARSGGRFVWKQFGFLLDGASFGAGKGLAEPVARFFPNRFGLVGAPRADTIWSYGAERHLAATRDEVRAIVHDAACFQGAGVERLPAAIFASTALNGMTAKTAEYADLYTGFGLYEDCRQDDHVTILTGRTAAHICDTVRSMQRHQRPGAD